MLLPLAILLSGAILVHGEVRNERNIQLSNSTGNNAVITGPYIEVLRGRDGRDGRDGKEGKDGEQGETGEQGIQGEPGPPGPPGGGVVYTRWGRTTCPDTPGTELVYAGIAGGSFYNHAGGGANYLCLPEEPEYLEFQAGNYDASYLYGAEYKSDNPGPLHSMRHHNVPCAVCHVQSRAATFMFPARISCPVTWTREYYGYLMSSHRTHRRTLYECMDRNGESIPGSAADTNGALFYFNEATCNGLPCPPYDTQKEVTCVVCSK